MSDFSFAGSGYRLEDYEVVPPFEDKPIVYISGPMTGLPEFNYPEFERVSEALKELGYEVVSPAQPELLGDGIGWDFCMRSSIVLLMKCNAIYMLDGYENSRGAMLEYAISGALKMVVLNEIVGSI